MNTSTHDLLDRFAQTREAGKRHKDAAKAIGISEGQAIALHAGTSGRAIQATPLRGPWLELLQGLEACGPVLALTRNESTVHEKTGTYRNLSGSGHVALALGEEIDLRLFFNHWHAGFAVSEGASQSLQFFDKSGVAVHKVFARDATDRAAFQALIDKHADHGQVVAFVASESKPQPRPDGAIDASALSGAWAEMKDTHEFFSLLKKFDVERQQSFRLTEGAFTHRAAKSTLRDLLHEAAFDGTPIMVFVGSPGCIQIHSGPVQRIEPMEMHGMRWLNVLDPGFNLHLREDLVESVWVVRKPTSDGVVTSVEAFDVDGTLMAMFFGVRKPGKPELDAWRAIVEKVAPQGAAA
ncbi:ChuX/HutX family heme-like substrate-binding protein [Variovorax dokdonensis]|uniref:ChuX/HutX family heme-like substrate-binding protein n=1 Tax=Variovorax dokdonensis TaxID=344883 RepID=A0ABT7NE45_9BURK|nr:ChuX/HutX family heme-like substrate-binding protein [Variovorax dokdonensis]MDM0046135.1 ChuX/HutX family heme-like substrate-binding protein [Variovorax dokdonensis]